MFSITCSLNCSSQTGIINQNRMKPILESCSDFYLYSLHQEMVDVFDFSIMKSANESLVVEITFFLSTNLFANKRLIRVITVVMYNHTYNIRMISRLACANKRILLVLLNIHCTYLKLSYLS